ncbi:IPT/TIG domain-containing protein [Leptospira ognonensis]|nr:IPT/TIG domain-containing protein [Leptospira ognonensis]
MSVSPDSGIVGDVITITGTNFSTNLEDNKVTFGTDSAGVKAYLTKMTTGTVVTATTTSLTVAIPTGAERGYISVLAATQRYVSAAIFSPRQYKFYFTTSTATPYNGNLGGFSGANTKCNSEDSRPDKSIAYKAWLYIDSSSFQVPSQGKVYSHSSLENCAIGSVSSSSCLSLFTGTGSLTNPTLSAASNSTGIIAWTGRDLTNTCSGWTSTAGNGNYGIGSQSSTYLNSSTRACTGVSVLYCYEP